MNITHGYHMQHGIVGLTLMILIRLWGVTFRVAKFATVRVAKSSL